MGTPPKFRAIDILEAKLTVDDNATGINVDKNEGAVIEHCNWIVPDPSIPANKATGFDVVTWHDCWVDA